MALPTLTWNKSTEQTIPCAGATVTYAEFIGKMKELIDASTHWNCTQTLDAGNSRGHLDISPKSLTAGITEMRALFAMSTGTVGAASPNEKPSVQYRLAPWVTATSSLAARMWIGVSPDANALANDPWTTGGTQPYTKWTKFLPLNSTTPPAGQTMWIIESAEVLVVAWTYAADSVNYFIVGKFVESPDGNSAMMGVSTGYSTSEASISGTAWASSYNRQSNSDYAPFSQCSIQHSAGVATRQATVAIDSSGALYGLGSTQFETMTGTWSSKRASATDIVLESIMLNGGPYTGGSQTGFFGFARQMRWGPDGTRLNSIVASAQTQAYHLTYHSSIPQKCGIWFDNFR